MNKYQHPLLIVNPVSGQARGLRLGQQIRNALDAKGVVGSVRVTNGRGDAQRWAQTAADDGYDLLVVIGGDGTVGEVVAGQACSEVKVPIGVVPVGTANVVAIALALPWLAGLAIDNILEGRVLPFDVGYLPELDRHFFLMAAIGYPAKIIQDSPRRLKNLFGVFTYVGAGIRNALNLDQVRVLIEDETGQTRDFRGHTVLLSNVGKIGDINLKVSPDTSAHDGQFDLTIISSRSFWDVVKVVFRMLTWRYKPTSRLHHFQSSKVVVVTDPPVAVQIDGEDLGHTPLAAEVIHHGVRLIVGSRYREDSDRGNWMSDIKLPLKWPRDRWSANGK